MVEVVDAVADLGQGGILRHPGRRHPVVLQFPGGAAVVRAEHRRALDHRAGRQPVRVQLVRRRFAQDLVVVDERVDHVRLRARDIDSDPTPVPGLRQTVVDRRPRASAIRRLVDAASRVALLVARVVPLLPYPLPRRRVQRVRVRRVHHQVDRARVLVDVQHLVPRASAVRRLRPGQAGDVDRLVVGRIDAHLAEIHRPRILVVHLAPRRAGVVGAVETCGLIVQRLRAAPSALTSAARRRAGSFFATATAAAAAIRVRLVMDMSSSVRFQGPRPAKRRRDEDLAHAPMTEAVPRLAGVPWIPGRRDFRLSKSERPGQQKTRRSIWLGGTCPTL